MAYLVIFYIRNAIGTNWFGFMHIFVGKYYNVLNEIGDLKDACTNVGNLIQNNLFKSLFCFKFFQNSTSIISCFHFVPFYICWLSSCQNWITTRNWFFITVLPKRRTYSISYHEISLTNGMCETDSIKKNLLALINCNAKSL